MGKIFFIMGKSCSGKDSIARELLKCKELRLSKMIMHTTRPKRANETNEYYFVSQEEVKDLANRYEMIIGERYCTENEIWHYCLFDSGYKERIADGENFLFIGNPESCVRFIQYFSVGTVCPIYIDVMDEILIKRAIRRQEEQEKPDYREMCRRFSNDDVDYRRDDMPVIFENNTDINNCVSKIKKYISSITNISLQA